MICLKEHFKSSRKQKDEKDWKGFNWIKIVNNHKK